MSDLLDDEFNEVQQSALTNLYEFLQNYTLQEIKQSNIIEALVRLYTANHT